MMQSSAFLQAKLHQHVEFVSAYRKELRAIVASLRYAIINMTTATESSISVGYTDGVEFVIADCEDLPVSMDGVCEFAFCTVLEQFPGETAEFLVSVRISRAAEHHFQIQLYDTQADGWSDFIANDATFVDLYCAEMLNLIDIFDPSV